MTPPVQQLTADDIIQLLDLAPHPEGGRYRETFRDSVESDGRAASTAIYFLLRAGEKSRWHTVDAAEGWHWYAGSPLRLEIATSGAAPTIVALGANLAAGERRSGRRLAARREYRRLDARWLYCRARLSIFRLQDGARRLRTEHLNSTGLRHVRTPRRKRNSAEKSADCPLSVHSRRVAKRGAEVVSP